MSLWNFHYYKKKYFNFYSTVVKDAVALRADHKLIDSPPASAVLSIPNFTEHLRRPGCEFTSGIETTPHFFFLGFLFRS